MSIFNRKLLKVGLGVSIFVLVLSLFNLFGGASKAQASGGSTCTTPLYGYIWSSTIGWISVNSANIGAGGGGPYSLCFDDVGNLFGYAWSSNIGWIQFGNLSGFPTTGAQRLNARIANPTNSGTVTGWARACSGTSSGDCSTMTSRTDGWDGWIELSGASHSVNYTYNDAVSASSTVTGYSWGSDVLGWMSWNVRTGVNPPSGGQQNNNGGGNTSDVSCSSSLNGTTVTWTTTPTGGSYTYVWVVDGATTTDTTASVTKTFASGNHSATVTVSGVTASPVVAICQPSVSIIGGGAPASLTITVNPNGRYPVVTNTDTSGNPIAYAKVRKGVPFTLTGQVNGITAGTGNIYSLDPNPVTPVVSSKYNDSQQITQVTPSVIYTLSGISASGSTLQTQIQVQAVDPAIQEK